MKAAWPWHAQSCAPQRSVIPELRNIRYNLSDEDLNSLIFRRCKLKILIADDFAASRRLIAAALRSGGIQSEIHEVANGIDAAEALRIESFDCAFIDYRMPGMDGLEVLREARMRGNSTPIIVTTGEGDEITAVAELNWVPRTICPKRN